MGQRIQGFPPSIGIPSIYCVSFLYINSILSIYWVSFLYINSILKKTHPLLVSGGLLAAQRTVSESKSLYLKFSRIYPEININEIHYEPMSAVRGIQRASFLCPESLTRYHVERIREQWILKQNFIFYL